MASQTNQLEDIYNENVAIDDVKFKEQRGFISSLVIDTLIPQVMDKFIYVPRSRTGKRLFFNLSQNTYVQLYLNVSVILTILFI